MIEVTVNGYESSATISWFVENSGTVCEPNCNPKVQMSETVFFTPLKCGQATNVFTGVTTQGKEYRITQLGTPPCPCNETETSGDSTYTLLDVMAVPYYLDADETATTIYYTYEESYTDMCGNKRTKILTNSFEKIDDEVECGGARTVTGREIINGMTIDWVFYHNEPTDCCDDKKEAKVANVEYSKQLVHFSGETISVLITYKIIEYVDCVNKERYGVIEKKWAVPSRTDRDNCYKIDTISSTTITVQSVGVLDVPLMVKQDYDHTTCTGSTCDGNSKVCIDKSSVKAYLGTIDKIKAMDESARYIYELFPEHIRKVYSYGGYITISFTYSATTPTVIDGECVSEGSEVTVVGTDMIETFIPPLESEDCNGGDITNKVPIQYMGHFLDYDEEPTCKIVYDGERFGDGGIQQFKITEDEFYERCNEFELEIIQYGCSDSNSDCDIPTSYTKSNVVVSCGGQNRVAVGTFFNPCSTILDNGLITYDAWITNIEFISPMIYCSVNENTSDENRNGTITLLYSDYATGENKSIEYPVSQNACAFDWTCGMMYADDGKTYFHGVSGIPYTGTSSVTKIGDLYTYTTNCGPKEITPVVYVSRSSYEDTETITDLTYPSTPEEVTIGDTSIFKWSVSAKTGDNENPLSETYYGVKIDVGDGFCEGKRFMNKDNAFVQNPFLCDCSKMTEVKSLYPSEEHAIGQDGGTSIAIASCVNYKGICAKAGLIRVTCISDWITNVSTTISNSTLTVVGDAASTTSTNIRTAEVKFEMLSADTEYHTPLPSEPPVCTTSVTVYQDAYVEPCVVSDITCTPSRAELTCTVSEVNTVITITDNACSDHKWSTVVNGSEVIGNSSGQLVISTPGEYVIKALSDTSKTCTFSVVRVLPPYEFCLRSSDAESLNIQGSSGTSNICKDGLVDGMINVGAYKSTTSSGYSCSMSVSWSIGGECIQIVSLDSLTVGHMSVNNPEFNHEYSDGEDISFTVTASDASKNSGELYAIVRNVDSSKSHVPFDVKFVLDDGRKINYTSSIEYFQI